jgi:hypothetical protein
MHLVQSLVFVDYQNYEGSRDTFYITSVTRAPCARRFLLRTQHSHFYWLIPSYGLKILLKVSGELPEDTITFRIVSFLLPPFPVYFICPPKLGWVITRAILVKYIQVHKEQTLRQPCLSSCSQERQGQSLAATSPPD